MFEQINPLIQQTPESLEARDSKLREKIGRAQERALDVDIDADLVQRYADMCEAEFLPVPPKDFDMAELKNLEARVLEATARVDTIVDF